MTVILLSPVDREIVIISFVCITSKTRQAVREQQQTVDGQSMIMIAHHRYRHRQRQRQRSYHGKMKDNGCISSFSSSSSSSSLLRMVLLVIVILGPAIHADAFRSPVRSPDVFTRNRKTSTTTTFITRRNLSVPPQKSPLQPLDMIPESNSLRMTISAATGGPVLADLGSAAETARASTAFTLPLPFAFHQIIENPVTWSVIIMTTIVGLLFVWETLVEEARENVPTVVEDVIDQVLQEMGSLGFIGLFLDTFVVHQPVVRDALLKLSEEVLGDEELVLETFEFLHTVFFQTAILFFVGASYLIVRTIDTIKTVADLADEAIDEAERQVQVQMQQGSSIDQDPNGSKDSSVVEACGGTSNMRTIIQQDIMGKDIYASLDNQASKTTASDNDVEDLIAILLLEEAAKQKIRTIQDGEIIPMGVNDVWKREFSLTQKQRGAEAVIIRERLIREMNLGRCFRIADYLQKGGIFSKNEGGSKHHRDESKSYDDDDSKSNNASSATTKERFNFIEISPAVWIPLIPSIALSNALDLSHDVVNAQSANAAASSGYFVSTPWVIWPSFLTQAGTLVWGLTNYWKMAAMKQMLLPGLAEVDVESMDTSSTGTKTNDISSRSSKRVVLCAPMVEDDALRKNFSVHHSTPFFARWFEERKSSPAKNRIDELYGVVGANGSEFYFESIKFHLWKCATGWIAFSQILPRDLYALTHPSDMIGAPEYLVPEIVVFSLFVALDLFQAVVLVPTTIINYSIITTVQDFVSSEQEYQKNKE